MDIEGPHEHAHAHHGTGFRWLDISLSLSAMAVSVISLFLAIEHGRTMEKLVAANSYPNISVTNSNLYDFQTGKGVQPAIVLEAVNTGVGPARFRSIEMAFGGKPVASTHELLKLCCGPAPARKEDRMGYYFPGDVRGSLLPVKEKIMLIGLPKSDAGPRWAQLDAQRSKISVTTCYCSVFDECYRASTDAAEPKPVRQCPEPRTPFLGT